MTNPSATGPAIRQTWNENAVHDIRVDRDECRFSNPIRMGIVVGTYAAVPYVHLQLEARRRLYSGVPILVHDDGSHKAEELRELCDRYGCDFECNVSRLPACLGDLSAFYGGLRWAVANRIDLLLKVSRRWVFLVDWVPSLAGLAALSQYATYGSYTTTFNFGFRTECVALDVARWSTGTFLDECARTILREQPVFVEGYIHEYARRFEKGNGNAAESWRIANPMTPDRNGYALWTLLGTDRCERSPNFLWHDSASYSDYHSLSRQWGLPYSPEDFRDPNQGGGIAISRG